MQPKLDEEYTRATGAQSSPQPTRAAEDLVRELDWRRPRCFDRSLIACSADQKLVREARRMDTFRVFWGWVMRPFTAMIDAIAVAHRTHADVLNPPSAADRKSAK